MDGTDGSDRQVADHRAVRLVNAGPQPHASQHLDTVGVAEKERIGVGPDQLREALRIEMVPVLVRDDDDMKVPQLREVAGETSGIDQDPDVGALDEQAGVAEMSDLHGSHGTATELQPCYLSEESDKWDRAP